MPGINLQNFVKDVVTSYAAQQGRGDCTTEGSSQLATYAATGLNLLDQALGGGSTWIDLGVNTLGSMAPLMPDGKTSDISYTPLTPDEIIFEDPWGEGNYIIRLEFSIENSGEGSNNPGTVNTEAPEPLPEGYVPEKNSNIQIFNVDGNDIISLEPLPIEVDENNYIINLEIPAEPMSEAAQEATDPANAPHLTEE